MGVNLKRCTKRIFSWLGHTNFKSNEVDRKLKHHEQQNNISGFTVPERKREFVRSYAAHPQIIILNYRLLDPDAYDRQDLEAFKTDSNGELQTPDLAKIKS